MPISFEELDRNYHERGIKILELEKELEEIKKKHAAEMNAVTRKLKVAIEGLDEIAHSVCNPTYDRVCMAKASRALGKIGLVSVSYQDCFDRNHTGLERLIHNIGMGKKVFPDPELGQNVAMLAMIIQGFFDSVSERKSDAHLACSKMNDIIKAVRNTREDLNSLKVYRG